MEAAESDFVAPVESNLRPSDAFELDPATTSLPELVSVGLTVVYCFALAHEGRAAPYSASQERTCTGPRTSWSAEDV